MVLNYKKKTNRSEIDEKAVKAALLDFQAKVPPHRATQHQSADILQPDQKIKQG